MPCGIYVRHPRKSIEERFWSRVDKLGENECWNWLGSKLRGGYGNLNIDGGTFQAHRVSYILHFGEIPDGMLVCHTCDNPPCVNPKHLWLGTHLDNARDKVNKHRQAKGEFCGRVKYTAEEIGCIRLVYFYSHCSMHKIARLYKITYSHINAILHNRVWKNENFCFGK